MRFIDPDGMVPDHAQRTYWEAPLDDIYRMGNTEVARIKNNQPDRNFDVVQDNGNLLVTGERSAGSVVGSPIPSIKTDGKDNVGFDFNRAGNIVLGGVGFISQSAETIAKLQIATEARSTGNIVKAVTSIQDLKPLARFSQRLGYAGVALNAASLTNDLWNGNAIKTSQLVDFGIGAGLSILTVTNPVAIIGLGVYGVADSYGAFDSIKKEYLNQTIIPKK